MESSLCLVQSLVSEVQKELFSDNINIQSSVSSPSAYDTAWLAMIPSENLNSQNQCRCGPMFESCLSWVIENQKEGGFWGESDEGGHLPTIDALPATLLCMVALKKWNRGRTNINQGLAFIESKMVEEILLKLYEHKNLPRWFVLVFPAAIELAEAAALGVVFPENLRGPIADIFFKRSQILAMWDGEMLTGHSKTIFDALDDFVNEVAANFPPHEGIKMVANLRIIWHEAFKSWMVEKTWSVTGYIARMDEYLENASISIAVHTIALPATSSFLNLISSNGTQNLEYHKITKLLMSIARLLNDTQSYQKEEAEGKMNSVHLHMKQNPNPKACIEDSIAHVNQILEMKMKEFMKHAFTDDDSMTKSCRQLHLSCVKVFHMFFNKDNRFDSETALVNDIKKVIYLPIRPYPEPKTAGASLSPNQNRPFLQACSHHLIKRTADYSCM